MPSTYENSERHFWDKLTRDAHTFREMISPLQDLLHTAFDTSLQPPMGDMADKWYVHSMRYGRFESASLVACLEWLTRAVKDDQQRAKAAEE